MLLRIVFVVPVLFAAACNDTAVVLDISSNRKAGELDAVCVELDAGGGARFGRRYDVTATGNPLPQSLTALAAGRPSVQAIVYGMKRGLVIAQARQDLPFKSGASLHVPVTLDRCQPRATSATFTNVPSTYQAERVVLVPAHLASPGDLVVGGVAGQLGELTAATTIEALVGRGGGNVPALPSGTPPPPRTLAMVSADVDGDCRPEVILLVEGAAPSVWRDGGDGTYERLGSIGAAAMLAAAAGDVDGDGKTDLVVAGGGEAHVWLGDGSGKLHELAGALDQPPADATAVALADLDGDGNLDLVLGQGSAMPAVSRVYVNDKAGSAHFTLAAGALPPRPLRVSSIATGDVDGNGTIDVVMSTLAGPMRVYLNRGDAYLDDRSFALLPDETSGDVPSVLMHDLNGDCLPDLVVPRAGAAPLLWLSQGGGVLAPGPALGGSDAAGAAADDVNGDGAPDLLLFGGATGLALELQK